MPLMIGIQMLSARIGFVTHEGLAANIGKMCPRWLTMGTDRPARRRQHHQHRGRRRRDGGIAEAVRRRPAAALRARLRRACASARRSTFPTSASVRVLKWLTLALFAYVAVILAVSVPWKTGDQPSRCSPGTTSRPESRPRTTPSMVVAVLGTTISPYLFFWQAAQEVEDDHRRPERARAAFDHPGIRGRAPLADQAGHLPRHDVLEPDRAVHRRRHRGDAQPARHHQHPDLGAGGRGAAPGGRRVRVRGLRDGHHRHWSARGAGAGRDRPPTR